MRTPEPQSKKLLRLYFAMARLFHSRITLAQKDRGKFTKNLLADFYGVSTKMLHTAPSEGVKVTTILQKPTTTYKKPEVPNAAATIPLLLGITAMMWMWIWLITSRYTSPLCSASSKVSDHLSTR